VNLPELWSSNPLARRAVLSHRTGDLCLDKAFDLIEGHPILRQTAQKRTLRWAEDDGDWWGQGKVQEVTLRV